MALSSLSAASLSPKYLSIITAERIIAIGFAIPFPAISGAEPCTGSNNAPLFPILAEGISRIVYAATIEDSNRYFCKEYPVSIKKIIDRSNSPIKLVEKLHRDKAIAVLKEHRRL